MADLPISGLPAITVVSDSYLLAAVSESVTAQMTVKQVGDAYSSSLSLFPYTGSAQITGSLGVTGSVSISGSSSIIGGFNIRNFTAFGNPASVQIRTYAADATTDGAWYSWGREFLQMGPINSGTDATFTMAFIPADNYTGVTPVDRPSLYFNTSSQIYLNDTDFRIYSPSVRTFKVERMNTVLSGSLNVSGSITQTNVTSSLVKADSNGTLVAATAGQDYTPTAYLSAYHTASLVGNVENTPLTMSYSTTDFSYGGITISGSYSDKIKIANAGVYNIQFSAQTSKTSGTSTTFYIWLAKNGVEVPSTNTGVTLAGGANDVSIPAWNFFVSASAGDYYQLMFAATHNNAVIQYLPSGSAGLTGPAVPSVILTVNRIA